MANIKGIELASDIYDLEDTQGRAATQTAQNTANNASDKADSNETAIEAIKNVIPSTAASTNKLVTEGDLSGLCRIVVTTHTVESGFQINNRGEAHPNCSWSQDIVPTPPSANAVLIAVFYAGSTWFPNVTTSVRRGSAFNLVSFEDYTFSSGVNFNCVWSVPNP